MRRIIAAFGRFDWILLLAVVTLSAIGLMMIYGIGISRGAEDLFQFKKQLIALACGLVFIFAASMVEYRQLRAFALTLYGVGVVALTSVLLFGTTIRGTRGWFVIGRLSFQPVELAKILLAIFLAWYFSRHAHRRLEWIHFAGSALATAVYVALVMLQPDFGSAMVMLGMWIVCAVLAGLPRRAWTVLFATMALGAIVVAAVGLKPYQQARLNAFLHPEADPRGAGYNVTQARIAIGSGGWWGKGIGEGSQTRLRFLPEASTDFMFSVVGEELGFIGILIVLLLFGVVLVRLIRLAMASDDPFAQFLLLAFTALFGIHIIVNVGMNLGLLPVTGIPLPFVSAAPSSLLVTMLAIAIVQSVAISTHPASVHGTV